MPSSTQLYKVSDETAIRYPKELEDKYAPGAIIADVPSNKIGSNKGIFKVNNRKVLKDRMILEVLVQEAKILAKVLDYAKNHRIKIRDIKGKLYNLVMKTIFNSTWVGNHICTEEATLSQLDGYNKTRYSRRKNKEFLNGICYEE